MKRVREKVRMTFLLLPFSQTLHLKVFLVLDVGRVSWVSTMGWSGGAVHAISN